MASQMYTLVPNGSDELNGSDWSLQTTIGGDTRHAAIASASTTRYIYANTTLRNNQFRFDDVTDDVAGIHGLSFTFNWNQSTASETASVRIILQDGGDGDASLYSVTTFLTSAALIGKNQTYTSIFYPFHSGTTSWTKDNINDLKATIYCLDNDTNNSASPANEMKILYFAFNVLVNKTDSSQPGTYDNSEKGVEVSNGKVEVSNGKLLVG